MNLQWAQTWITSYARDPRETLAMWTDGPFRFDDPLAQGVETHEQLLRVFEPYGNADPDNGIGIHTFEALEYIGDERSGATVWRWTAEHAAAFFGVPTGGKTITTTGVSVHTFDEHGKITRELAHWDAISIGIQIGIPFQVVDYWR